MDEIAKKIAGLGLPGIVLLIIAVSSAGSNTAIAAALTAMGGPFGIVGGIGILGLITVLGDTVSGYGIEFKDDMTYRQTRVQMLFFSKPKELITGNTFTGIWYVSRKKLHLDVRTMPK